MANNLQEPLLDDLSLLPRRKGGISYEEIDRVNAIIEAYAGVKNKDVTPAVDLNKWQYGVLLFFFMLIHIGNYTAGILIIVFFEDYDRLWALVPFVLEFLFDFIWKDRIQEKTLACKKKKGCFA